jgi:electron transfer flavoprotein beta subunit
MHIVVCIKQVPDNPNIRIDPERMTIIREGLKSIINPLDCVALEAALVLKKKQGGCITVLSMGPPQSEEALFEALAYGADQAILLTDIAFAGADTLATSHVLARAIARLEPFPDLILCGKQTIDSDTGHVGPQIAEELNLPQVCNVNEIHPEGNFLTVKQISDHFLNTLRVSLPALLTVGPELSIPHHLPLGDVEAAFLKKKITQWGLPDLGLEPQEVGLPGSATKVWKLQKTPQKKQGELLSGPPHVLVEAFIKKLENLSILDDEETEHE